MTLSRMVRNGRPPPSLIIRENGWWSDMTGQGWRLHRHAHRDFVGRRSYSGKFTHDFEDGTSVSGVTEAVL
jgi:hypothetical protein